MVIAQRLLERRRATSAGRAERDEIERLQTLANLASQLSAALTTQDVGRVVERQLTEEMGAAGVGVVPECRQQRARIGRHRRFPSPVVTAMGADAIGSGLPVLFRTEDEYLQRFGPASRIGGITSAIGWPLAADGGPSGAAAGLVGTAATA